MKILRTVHLNAYVPLYMSYRMKLAAGLGAVITVDPEGVTIRPQEEAK